MFNTKICVKSAYEKLLNWKIITCMIGLRYPRYTGFSSAYRNGIVHSERKILAKI